MISDLKDAWQASAFHSEELVLFARNATLNETRRGLVSLSLVLLAIFASGALLFYYFNFSHYTVYTTGLLAVLAAHVMISSQAARDARALYLLGTTLIMISGTAFVLLAHRAGDFNQVLFASVALLFMVAPLVPWGLREAMLVTGLIYVTFTLSTWTAVQRFDNETLWSLQFIMISAGLISLMLVVRNTVIRKEDIRTRFDLEQANRKMMYLSNKDPLTGAWNRRFLKHHFDRFGEERHASGEPWHFAFVDVDDFKPMNDNCGHDYGDDVLRTLANVFAASIGEHGYLVRMGGDEFAVLFSHADPEALLDEAWHGLNSTMPPSRDCAVLPVGLSIGLVTVYPGVSLSLIAVSREADQVLYQAKDRKEHYRSAVNIVATEVRPATERQETGA
ncbi:MAG: GGDEF domain-containing protein [Gammaproteobacteria bacterium]